MDSNETSNRRENANINDMKQRSPEENDLVWLMTNEEVKDDYND